MKYVISFFLVMNAQAAPIRIMYENDSTNAQTVKEIFTVKYSIPEDLIAMSQVRSCDELNSRGKLDLCLKNNGDLEVVSVDKGFVSESLKIFHAP